MADRDVTVRLKIQSDAQQASQSMKQLATDAERLKQATGQAGQSQSLQKLTQDTQKAAEATKALNAEQQKSGSVRGSAAQPARPAMPGLPATNPLRSPIELSNSYQDPKTGQWFGENTPQGKALAQQGAQVPKSPQGQPGQGGLQGLMSGDLGKLAGVGAVIGVAVKGSEAAMKAAAQAIEVLGNSATTNSQKLIGLGKAIPVLGGLVEAGEAIYDAITGVSETIRKMQRDAAQQDIRLAGDKERQAVVLPIQMAQQQAAYQRQAQGGSPIVQFNAPDQLYGPGGDLAFQQAEQRAAAASAQRQAVIESKAAQAIANDQRQRAGSYDDAIQEQQKKRRKAEEQYQGYVDTENMNPLRSLKQEKIESSGKAAAAAKEEISLQEQKTAALQGYQATLTSAIEKERSARQANIDASKTELEIIKAKETLLKGQATSFGSLSVVQRQAALEAAKRIEREGIDKATPEAKALVAAAGGGNFIAAESQKSAVADPRFKQFLQTIGQKDVDLKSLIEQKIKLQSEIIVTGQLDTDNVAKKLEDLLKGLVSSITVTLAEKIKAQEAKAKADQDTKNTAGG